VRIGPAATERRHRLLLLFVILGGEPWFWRVWVLQSSCLLTAVVLVQPALLLLLRGELCCRVCALLLVQLTAVVLVQLVLLLREEHWRW
jgi:hypothetical protein